MAEIKSASNICPYCNSKNISFNKPVFLEKRYRLNPDGTLKRNCYLQGQVSTDVTRDYCFCESCLRKWDYCIDEKGNPKFIL